MPSPVALPTPRWRFADGSRATAVLGLRHLRDMLCEFVGEMSDEEHRQHFRLEGRRELVSVRDKASVRRAKFAVGVNRRGAHQVADVDDKPIVWLLTVAQSFNRVFKHAKAFVRPRNHKVRFAIAPCLLEGRLRVQSVHICIAWASIE